MIRIAWREVIGVVQSIHEDGLYEEPPRDGVLAGAHENFFGTEVGRVDVRHPQRARRHRELRRKRSGRRSGR